MTRGSDDAADAREIGGLGARHGRFFRRLNASELAHRDLAWNSRFSKSELRTRLEMGELQCWGRPHSTEYLVTGAWRHRSDIAAVLEVGGGGGTAAALRSWLDWCRGEGLSLVMLDFHETERNLALYEACGFTVLEELLEYACVDVAGAAREQGAVVRAVEDFDMQELLALDNAAFGWLWANSREEFDWYLGCPGVRVYVLPETGLAQASPGLGGDGGTSGTVDGGSLLGYAGVSVLGSMAHLDRIAVRPDRQGAGLGRVLLRAVMLEVTRLGVQRIGLTTQAANAPARRVYACTGFSLTGWRGHVYGLQLRQPG